MFPPLPATGLAPPSTTTAPPPHPLALGQLLVPDRKLAADPTWTTSLRNTFTSSWFVWLLPFIPICWTLHFTHQSDIIVSIFSFIAVLPLASLLCFATEQLSLRVGNALGGLLNATFGNAVELLISILALTKGRIGLVQAAMVGSILSNTLLVLGMCYFAGGLRFHEQMYTIASSQVQISLLGLSIAAIVLPAGYHLAVEALGTRGTAEASHILAISRGLSFMLLSVYVMYLVFILYSEWERFFCGEELCVADWVVWVPDAFDQLMRSECRTPAWPANAGI
jgi:Ca2+:H+ antiporter